MHKHGKTQHGKPVSKTMPPRPMPGLGRGLSDIIAQGARTSSTPPVPPSAPPPSSDNAGIRQLPLSLIKANPNQPRIHFTGEPLDELVSSIREKGVLQPITVRPRDQHFEIIAGERRFRACQKLGLETIPVLVKNATDEETLELALIENLQREDLDPIEEARGYRHLTSSFSLTQEQIAVKIGKKRATVANALRLLDLPDEVQGYLAQKRLTPGHAKAILSLSDQEKQLHFAREIIRRGLNVRQAEQFAQSHKPGAKPQASGTASPKTGPHPLPPNLQVIQDAIQQKLGTKVCLHASGNGGRVEVFYYTPTDLDRLLEILQIKLG
ncbi:MAG: ParB/RepB/Spo0J family partition protein [Verrucomicrobiae bacterium]|nr:ParB/RepB/Spo0J family partition protein [Verrucomicrobiae bacterium]